MMRLWSLVVVAALGGCAADPLAPEFAGTWDGVAEYRDTTTHELLRSTQVRLATTVGGPDATVLSVTPVCETGGVEATGSRVHAYWYGSLRCPIAGQEDVVLTRGVVVLDNDGVQCTLSGLQRRDTADSTTLTAVTVAVTARRVTP